MPKVTSEHRENRRRQILDAALRCFAERGFQRTSMADIIAESGLSAGAIYGHFSGKQEIVIAAARQIIGHRVLELGALPHDAPPSPGQVLRLLIDGMRRELPDIRILVQVWGEAAIDTEVLAVAEQIFPTLHGALHRVVVDRMRTAGSTETDAEERARSLVPLMLGIVQGYVVQSSLIRGFDGEAYLTTAERLLDG